ncbi:Maltose acetyltransferase-like protein [Elsinoe fawcettii]|nr:Maltose acetyltransferase-like protein [Elsinoe fawcettii]
MIFAYPSLVKVHPVVSDASKKKNPNLLQPASVARPSTSTQANASSATSQHTGRSSGSTQQDERNPAQNITPMLAPPPMARLKKALSMQSLRRRNEKAIEFAKTLSNVPWCDDYEKMISGMLYSCEAPELTTARNRARRIAQKFNTYVPNEEMTAEQVTEKRMEMIKGLFGKVGQDCYLEPSLQVDYGCNITIGDRFYANFK